jgi:hypothetical protein
MEGLAFESAALLGPMDPRVTSIIDGAEYVVALARVALDAIGGEAGLAERILGFHGSESVRVRRTIEGIGKIIDVKALVKDLRVGDAATHEALMRSGIVGRVVPLAVSTRITATGSVKISEVVQAVTGDAHFPYKAVRVALTGGGTSPMDLALHRRAPAPVRTVVELEMPVVNLDDLQPVE